MNKVYADGSGLVRLTYQNVSIAKGTVTKQYPLKGFAVSLRVSPLGKLVSKTTTGTAAADPPSDITDPTPLEYPRAAVPVGGIWTKSQAISGLGTMVARLRLVAVGTAQGQQTATITIAANQPMRLTSNGLAFSGTLAAAGRQTVFVQTGADVSSSHLAMSVRGVMAGTVNGVKITGTMTMSFSQDSVPQS